jgi:plastocyanin
MTLIRRRLITATGVFAALCPHPAPSEEVVTIRMRSDAGGEHVGFDPVGLFIQPGRTVRFLCEANYHTTTAYHPTNANHSLRIPRTAAPWTSDVLQPGEHFEVTLHVPGVYDYFCAPHEQAGMVGRLIVGEPTGPGSMPFDWFKGRPEGQLWIPVPDAARAVFPSTDEIMRRGSVAAKPFNMAH